MEHKIKDQKIFVRLRAVTALQRRYQRAFEAFQKLNDNAEYRGAAAWQAAKARKEAFEEVIAELELPLS